ncbi:hypothetical protein [Paenibacillus polymyxa]|uniref:hypothetical protein n=1 Tax=Paenibacillus polymyxa TaxID=1406 RepID=UPI002ED097BF|nr:hypothetical protein [Paenibacillus polymyxa]
MGVVTAELVIHQMLGVPIGSYLATVNWHIPFIMIGGCTFLLVILAFVLLPSMPAAPQQHKATSIVSRYHILLHSLLLASGFPINSV